MAGRKKRYGRMITIAAGPEGVRHAGQTVEIKRGAAFPDLTPAEAQSFQEANALEVLDDETEKRPAPEGATEKR